MRADRLGIIFVVLFIQACRAPAPPDTPPAVEHQVRGLAPTDATAVRGAFSAYFDAAVSGNASRWAALYATDAVMMPPNSTAIDGRPDIETWLKALPVAITGADGDAQEVEGTGDLAYLRGTYAMSMAVPGVTQPVRQQGTLLQIYRRQQDGTWLLTRDIWNANASPAGP